jgi:hypothetical protein
MWDRRGEQLARVGDVVRPEARGVKRPNDGDQPEPRVLAHPCPCCGGRMIVIETFERGRAPRASSLGEIRIDTS